MRRPSRSSKFYEDLGLLKRVDASAAPDEVTRATEAVLDQCAAG